MSVAATANSPLPVVSFSRPKLESQPTSRIQTPVITGGQDLLQNKINKIQVDQTPKFVPVTQRSYVNRGFFKIVWDYTATLISVIFKETILSFLQISSLGLYRRAPLEKDPVRPTEELVVHIEELCYLAELLDKLSKEARTANEFEDGFMPLFIKYSSNRRAQFILMDYFLSYVKDKIYEKYNKFQLVKDKHPSFKLDLIFMIERLGVNYILCSNVPPVVQLEGRGRNESSVTLHEIFIDLSFQVYVKYKEHEDRDLTDLVLKQMSVTYCNLICKKKYG